MKCNGQAQFYLVHLDLMKYWVLWSRWKKKVLHEQTCSVQDHFEKRILFGVRMNDDPIYWGCNITNNFVPLKTSIGLLTVFIFTSRKFWSRIQFLFWILERKEKSTFFTLEIVVEDVETVTQYLRDTKSIRIPPWKQIEQICLLLLWEFNNVKIS